jgi:hypothetical protein
VASAATGKATIIEGTQTITINTTAITNKSAIYVTFSDDYAPATRYWTDSIIPNTSFTIHLDKPVGQDSRLNWWIVN